MKQLILSLIIVINCYEHQRINFKGNLGLYLKYVDARSLCSHKDLTLTQNTHCNEVTSLEHVYISSGGL